jgi:hemoglobin
MAHHGTTTFTSTTPAGNTAETTATYATAMSIYDEIGGSGALSAAVDGFYDRVLADADLAEYFAGVDVQRLKGHQRAFIAAAIGGPNSYLGRAMADAHADLDITDDAFDATVGHLVEALADLGVPAGTIDRITTALAPLRTDIVAVD